MQRFRLFGLSLASDFPFAQRLVREPLSVRPPDLTLRCHLGRTPARRREAELVYASPVRTEAGESACRLYRQPDREVLRFSNGVEMWMRRSAIDALLPSREDLPVAELQILGPTLAYHLERLGRPALHASAVGIGGGAVAFLSGHGGGKSGLAAAFLVRGYPLATDDVLGVREERGTFRALAGYPQMRMWPDLAERFLPGVEDLPRVHPELEKRRVPVGEGGLGSFEAATMPLRRIFVLERSAAAAEPAITPLGPTEAMMALVAGSFTPYLVEAVGLQEARMSFFARLIRSVPLLRLRAPAGLEKLPKIVDRVLESLDSGDTAPDIGE